MLNALSSLWHPTQTLADLLTLHEHVHLFDTSITPPSASAPPSFNPLPKLTIAWLGDSTNVLHDMLVAYPRLGHKVRVAVPPNSAYQCPKPVWNLVKELDCEQHITWTHDPLEAVNGANVVVTDTW